MPISGRRKQEVSPGGGRTGIGANGELCVSGRKYQHTIRGVRCGKENWVGEGNLAGAGEGVELSKTTKTRMYEVLPSRLRSELLALSLPLFRSRLKTILFDHGLVLLGRECLRGASPEEALYKLTITIMITITYFIFL